jgi:prepilin-type N-terminal cleavage/methylation domain-containing protein
VSFASPPLRPRGRAGFTLIELMVALVIMGLLTTALWQIVRSQSAFVASETQREDAQDNARAALDVLTGDLRAALPRGVIRAGDAELELALPKAWGVACGGGSATSLTAVFPSLPTDVFIRSTASGLLVNTSAGNVPDWTPRAAVGGGRGFVSASAAVNLAAAPCTGMGAQGVGLLAYQFTGTNFPVATAGQVVMLYQLVRYDVAQSDGKWWLRRSTGMDDTGTTFTMTPLAGPIPAQDSLRFTYYTGATGVLQSPAPGTDVAILDSLSRIKVKVVTQSSGQYQGRSNYERDSSAVLLRNRVGSLQCSAGVAGAPC